MRDDSNSPGLRVPQAAQWPGVDQNLIGDHEAVSVGCDQAREAHEVDRRHQVYVKAGLPAPRAVLVLPVAGHGDEKASIETSRPQAASELAGVAGLGIAGGGVAITVAPDDSAACDTCMWLPISPQVNEFMNRALLLGFLDRAAFALLVRHRLVALAVTLGLGLRLLGLHEPGLLGLERFDLLEDPDLLGLGVGVLE
jgi:hypothetical protein